MQLIFSSPVYNFNCSVIQQQEIKIKCSPLFPPVHYCTIQSCHSGRLTDSAALGGKHNMDKVSTLLDWNCLGGLISVIIKVKEYDQKLHGGRKPCIMKNYSRQFVGGSPKKSVVIKFWSLISVLEDPQGRENNLKTLSDILKVVWKWKNLSLFREN